MEKLLRYSVGYQQQLDCVMDIVVPADAPIDIVIRDYLIAKNKLENPDRDWIRVKIINVNIISWEEALQLGYDEKINSNIPTY